MLRHILPLVLAALLGGLLPPAAAHQPSDSALRLRVEGARVELAWDIALRDLDAELGLDRDGDGLLRWREVREAWPAIEALAAAALQLDDARGQRCSALAGSPAQLVERGGVAHAALRATLDCGHPPATLRIDYRLFADSDPQHRGLLSLAGSDRAASPRVAVLDPREGPRDFALDPGAATDTRFSDFLLQGIWHILIGLDHVLFLVALLLIAVLQRGAQGWVPAPALRPALGQVLKIVTVFTLAHSLTLALAASGVLAPPSRWVESIIAASVLLAALNNLRPVADTQRLGLIGLFGLIHGFGFAGVLQELGLGAGGLWRPLLGFNLGVELGQLMLVALVLLLIWPLRRRPVYVRRVLPLGSLLIAALAAVWLVERAFDLGG